MARGIWIDGISEAIAAEVIAALGNDTNASDPEVLPFRRDWDALEVGCVISRLNGDDFDPIGLLENLIARQSPLTVIYLLEEPATRRIIEVMRRGAFDVLDWPAERERLAETIERALKASGKTERRLADIRAERQRLAGLSSGEMDVLNLMLNGKVNKVIAARLGIALRTVEARRKRVLEKMGTRSLPEIAGSLSRAGLLGRVASTSALTESNTAGAINLALPSNPQTHLDGDRLRT